MYQKIIRHTTKPNYSYIVLGYPYQPYNDCGLDAYYLATQDMYKACKKIQQNLREKGVIAQIVNNISLRDLSFKSGLTTILGINQMAMRDDCGSYIVLAAIETDDFDILAQATDRYVTSIDKCVDCGKCVEVCPTKALGYNGEFYPKKCLRSYQCGDPMPLYIAELMGKKFLGCNICQEVCPHNINICKIDAPQLVQTALYNSIHTIKPFKELIGANYARTKYLKANSIVYSAHTGNLEAIPKLQQLTNDYMYGELARWAIKKLENII
ncbi:MAG: 4Fe-4S binding protein [Firmicutes bacterium]|nr:4Fe-4S binding protein [Bacillota bacterium]MCL1953431.1 4Fe-4S binding protein [Bacillota bacterium]